MSRSSSSKQCGIIPHLEVEQIVYYNLDKGWLGCVWGSVTGEFKDYLICLQCAGSAPAHSRTIWGMWMTPATQKRSSLLT